MISHDRAAGQNGLSSSILNFPDTSCKKTGHFRTHHRTLVTLINTNSGHFGHFITIFYKYKYYLYLSKSVLNVNFILKRKTQKKCPKCPGSVVMRVLASEKNINAGSSVREVSEPCSKADSRGQREAENLFFASLMCPECVLKRFMGGAI